MMDILAAHMLVVLIVIFLDLTYSLGTDRLTIGVVGDVSNRKPDTLSFQYDGGNVTFVWINVDTDEIFHVYNAVREFDADPSVDVIIHADVSQASQRLQNLLQTRLTPLIRWGVKRKHAVTTPIDENCADDEAGVHNVYSSEMYCTRKTEDLNHRNVTVKISYTDVIPGAITKLLLRFKWKYVIIVHDTESEHEASNLIDQLSTSGILLIVINIDYETYLEDTIFKLYQEYVKDGRRLHVLVSCRYHCARKVIRVANTFDNSMSTRKRKTLLYQFSLWLIALHGYERGMSRGLRACAGTLDNVAIVAIPDWKGASTQTIVATVETILLEVEQALIEMNTSNWKDLVMNRLMQTAAFLHPSVLCQGFNIDTLLWAANKERSFRNVGYIDMSGQIMVTSNIFPNTKYGYNKRLFLVSILEYKPFIMANISANGTKTYYGFCIDLLDELAKTLNFTYVTTEPEDGKWGNVYDLEKELFTGLIGQLQRKEVDMVGAPISIQLDRARQMDFTYPFYYEITTIVMKRTDPRKSKWRTLIDPFKWEVHVSIGVALIIVTTLLWLIEKWNPFYRVNKNTELRRRNGGLQFWHNSFWCMYGALLCQGGSHLPDSVAGRTFVSCWWLFCIIVVGTYCGNLIAFLTVTKDKPPFSDLKELVEKKDEFKWGTLGGSFWETNFIHSSRVRLYKDIGRGIIEFNQTDPSVLSISPAEHINKALRGGYAWIGDKTFIDFSLATECDLVRSSDEFLPLSYAFGFQNNSPHAFIFSDQLMKIHESGLLKIWKRKWWPRLSLCEKDRIVTQTQPITLPDVQSAFYVCFVGIGLGFVALVVEIAFNRYKDYKRRWGSSDRQSSAVSFTTPE